MDTYWIYRLGFSEKDLSKELASEGLMKTEIAKRLGVGRATVYRALGD